MFITVAMVESEWDDCHCNNWQSLFEAVVYVPMAVSEALQKKNSSSAGC